MIGKIDGPGALRPAQPAKKAGKAGSADSAGFSHHLDEAGEAGPATGISSTSAVSGIIGLQEVDDATHHASKGKRRANDILDRLEDLRIQLLTGTISRSQLTQLIHIINTQRHQVTDPRLKEVLDEVDLRAQVELAKHAANL